MIVRKQARSRSFKLVDGSKLFDLNGRSLQMLFHGIKVHPNYILYITNMGIHYLNFLITSPEKLFTIYMSIIYAQNNLSDVDYFRKTN
jgi:hypothetical protein